MIKPLNKQTDDERYLTFTEAVKLLGAGTNNRVRNFVREGRVPSYRLLLTRGLRVRESDILSLIEVKEVKHDGSKQ
jgi:hypothetical protein